MPARLDEVRHRLDEEEPAHDHERVRDALAGEDGPPRRRARTAVGIGHRRHGRGGGGGVRHGRGVEVVAIGVGRLAVLLVGVAAAGGGGAFHDEAVVDERDAKAGAGAVLGGVGGVQEVGEEEADKLEGHGDDAVPDEGEEGSDGEAVDVDLV